MIISASPYLWSVSINGKQILHNISGRVGSVGRGQLLGILGGSGAGKSTLLNTLSGRILNQKQTPFSKLCRRPYNTVLYTSFLVLECCDCHIEPNRNQVTGTVGYKRQKFNLGESDSIKHISAYVMQHDILCPVMTCREALEFSAKLRRRDSKEAQAAIVNSVSQSLKLGACQVRPRNGNVCYNHNNLFPLILRTR